MTNDKSSPTPLEANGGAQNRCNNTQDMDRNAEKAFGVVPLLGVMVFFEYLFCLVSRIFCFFFRLCPESNWQWGHKVNWYRHLGHRCEHFRRLLKSPHCLSAKGMLLFLLCPSALVLGHRFLSLPASNFRRIFVHPLVKGQTENELRIAALKSIGVALHQDQSLPVSISLEGQS